MLIRILCPISEAESLKLFHFFFIGADEHWLTVKQKDKDTSFSELLCKVFRNSHGTKIHRTYTKCISFLISI